METNREEVNAARRKWVNQLRLDAIQIYGGTCQCPGCHTVHSELMTIDHIAGDGAEHRRSIGVVRRTGVDFYRWLKKHNYPEGFQTLCWNCNSAKGTEDKCPLAGEAH